MATYEQTQESQTAVNPQIPQTSLLEEADPLYYLSITLSYLLDWLSMDV